MVAKSDFSWVIENQKEFQAKLEQLGKVTSDFRIPFRIISSDFYKSQKEIFLLKSAGEYQDLSPKYKKSKEKKLGFAYPILVGATKNLSESTLSNKHANSIYFLGKQELQIGTNVEYGKYHQSDKPRAKIPERKFIFIDGFNSGSSRVNGRRERWIKIIDTHIQQLVTGRV